ncbi:MAG: polyketide cyclase [Proteobacteria bacterium]|nr:polyketide cyclase [Pseudomonadota bacterium]
MCKKLCKILLQGGAVAALGLVAVVSLQSNRFSVTRAARLDAPPSVIFAQVNNLHRWNDWSPWAKLDPNAKNSFEGPDAGVGASMSWEGNRDVGKGRMTITDSVGDERVAFLLEFQEPMTGTNTSQFTFVPEGDKTLVTWSMSGHKNFMAKAVGLFMNCEKMVGDQFDQGLGNLAQAVKEAKTAE